ncbi:MAG: hypothetical protein H7Y02_08960, partial [Candidatus Obscuribacterales bacterium]|nr:hypothetical protein [Steroidobacteraceae bacterium]
MTVLKRPLLPGLSRLAWWQLGLAGLTMVLLWSGGTQVTEALRYHRAGILAGQFWRLLTGHLVHFDFRHLALNL